MNGSLLDRIEASTPRAEVTIRKSQSRHDRFWVLTVAKCPYCHRLHQHGGGSTDDPPALGPRLSHCVTQSPRDYELIPIKEATS